MSKRIGLQEGLIGWAISFTQMYDHLKKFEVNEGGRDEKLL